MKRKKMKKNALLMVPCKNPQIQWIRNNNLITLRINRNRYIDKIMHKMFKTPECVNIELDEIGSFVWERCDGIHDIKSISESLRDRFGKNAEPAVERLLTYIKILINNNLIGIS